MAWLDPVRDQVRFGQVGLFLLAMCLADCCARTPRWPRGALVGLAVAIKLVPGVFLIYFLLTGRRDALGNAVLTAAAATLAGFALLPADSSAYWFGALLQGGDRTGAVDGTTNQAIQGIVARIFDEGSVRTAVWLVLALIVAYFGFTWARRVTLAADELTGTDANSLLLGAVAIVGLLSVVLSPVGWIHHLVWMIAVIGALAGDGRDTRRCLYALGVWFVFLWPLPWWGRDWIGPEHSAVAEFAGQVLRDSFGIAALVSIAVLGTWLVNRVKSGADQGFLRNRRPRWVRSPRDASRGGRRGPGRRYCGAVHRGGRAQPGQPGRRRVREMLRRQLQVASGSVDERALRDLAIVHYDALKEMSGHRSFSLALINAIGDGVVVSSINGRTETRTYAKVVQAGHPVETLSPRRATPCARPGSARARSCRWTTRWPTSAAATARPPAPRAAPAYPPTSKLGVFSHTPLAPGTP